MLLPMLLFPLNPCPLFPSLFFSPRFLWQAVLISFNKSGACPEMNLCTLLWLETTSSPKHWRNRSLFEQSIGSSFSYFNKSNSLSLKHTLVSQNKHHHHSCIQNQTQPNTNPTIRNKTIHTRAMQLPSRHLITSSLSLLPACVYSADYFDLISLEHNSD